MIPVSLWAQKESRSFACRQLLLGLDCQVVHYVQIAYFPKTMGILSQRTNISMLFQKTAQRTTVLLYQYYDIDVFPKEQKATEVEKVRQPL